VVVVLVVVTIPVVMMGGGVSRNRTCATRLQCLSQPDALAGEARQHGHWGRALLLQMERVCSKPYSEVHAILMIAAAD
jgi:hypothetical protein